MKVDRTAKVETPEQEAALEAWLLAARGGAEFGAVMIDRENKTARYTAHESASHALVQNNI